MQNEPTTANLSPALQQAFSQLSEELGAMVLKQFTSLLQTQQSNVQQSLESIINKQKDRIIRQAQRELQRLLTQQFGGGGAVLIELMANQVLPGIFDRFESGDFGGDFGFSTLPSTGFQQSGSQSLLEMGKSIQRVLERNG